MNEDFLLFMLLKPLGAIVFLGAIYGFIWFIWKKFPEGKLKRVLFFNLWAGKGDPWTEKYESPRPAAPTSRTETRGRIGRQ